MPDMNGAQLTKRLNKEYPHIKVIALTGFEDQSYLRQLLQAGVSGYVLKRVAAKELIHAIHIVAVGGIYLEPSMAGRVVGVVVGIRRTLHHLLDGNLAGRTSDAQWPIELAFLTERRQAFVRYTGTDELET